MTANRVTYTLDSTLDSVNKAEETAEKMAVETGFDEDESQRIAMAVREGAVNAVLHGNAYDPQKKMTVSYEKGLGKLAIIITDQGKGLDLKLVPNPLEPENLLKNSGRGIFLMQAFMDEVIVRNLDPGTEITMVKHVSDPAAAAQEEKK